MAGTHQIWAYALEENVKFWKMSESMTVGSCVAIAGTGKEENRNTSYPMKASFAQVRSLAQFFPFCIEKSSILLEGLSLGKDIVVFR